MSNNVIYYTTAPVDYDYGYTTVLDSRFAQTSEKMSRSGLIIRAVSIPEDRAKAQTARYWSGNYFTCDRQDMRVEIEAGYVTDIPGE